MKGVCNYSTVLTHSTG